MSAQFIVNRAGRDLFRGRVVRVQVPTALLTPFPNEPALYSDAKKCPLIGNWRSALWANDTFERKGYNEDQRQEWDGEPIGYVQGQQTNGELNGHDTSPRQLIFPVRGHNRLRRNCANTPAVSDVPIARVSLSQAANGRFIMARVRYDELPLLAGSRRSLTQAARAYSVLVE